MKHKKKEHLLSGREKQGELFAEYEVSSFKKPTHLIKRDMAFGKKMILRFSYENVVLLFIVFIMLAVLFFSLGVERGKRMAKQGSGWPRKPSANIVPQNADEEKRFDCIEQPIAETYQDTLKETVEETERHIQNISVQTVKPYTIQVISFKKEANVEREMERLKKDGYEVFTIPAREWFQICVGRYANKKDSEKDLNALKKRYPTCYVRRIDN